MASTYRRHCTMTRSSGPGRFDGYHAGAGRCLSAVVFLAAALPSAVLADAGATATFAAVVLVHTQADNTVR